MTDLRGASGVDPTAAAAGGDGALQRADGVELIGEMAGSGYRVPPSLARRGDGQMVQLTPLLYALLEAVDGSRDEVGVATVVSERTGRGVSPDNVRTLVAEQLRPLGLLTREDGSEPESKRSNPLLGLRLRVSVTDPESTRRLTAPFMWLFHPLVAVPLLTVFAVVCWWVLFRQGLAGAAYDAFERPGLLLAVFGLTVLSAGFHEFGHAAAARYGGATPGTMGAGVYLVWPAFYTDVTDSYRLGRGGRLRTDLGGLYFNAIVAVAVTGAWWVTGTDALLLLVATQLLQMVQQLTPLVRFDGYHVLADLTGVPDLFHRIKPTLLGALPWRWGDSEARVLKPWARVVVTVWVALVVPLLLLALFGIVMSLPRLLGSGGARLGEEWGLLGDALGAGDLVQTAARIFTMLALVLPLAAIIYMLVRLARQLATASWKATAGKPFKRAVAVVAGLAVVAALAWAWWPRTGTYHPIMPDESGTLTDLVRPLSAGTVPGVASRAVPAWERGDAGELQTVWDTSGALPTEAEPQLAVIMQPQQTGTPAAETAGDTSGETTSAEPEAWVFPFDQPLAPEPGDNQALAVVTEDETVAYDVALALVWVEDGEAALNTNEAYAFASCETCAAVAVAFQVVLVVGDNDVAAPQNLAGAVNVDCVNCLTYAVAQQLFITLDGPLSDEAMAQLNEIWAAIADFGQQIASTPLDQIDDQLDAFETAVLEVIEADQPGTVQLPSASPTESTTLDPTGTPSDEPTASPSEDGSSSPSESPTSSTTPSVTPSPTSPTTSASATPSGEPSASSSGAPSAAPSG